jgi:hypothetical protein
LPSTHATTRSPREKQRLERLHRNFQEALRREAEIAQKRVEENERAVADKERRLEELSAKRKAR